MTHRGFCRQMITAHEPSATCWSWRITSVTSRCSCWDCVAICKWGVVLFLLKTQNDSPFPWGSLTQNKKKPGLRVQMGVWPRFMTDCETERGTVYLSRWPQLAHSISAEAKRTIDFTGSSTLPFPSTGCSIIFLCLEIPYSQFPFRDTR